MGSVPQPDPTLLTTKQLQREIDTLRALVDSAIAGMRDVFHTRFSAMEQTLATVAVNAEERHKACAQAISALKDLHDERFRGVASQFISDKAAVDAALIAVNDRTGAALIAVNDRTGLQNEANNASFSKSEMGFAKQIEALGATVNQYQRAIDDKINDLKSRIDQNVGRDRGTGIAWAIFVGAAGLVLSIALVSINVLTRPH